MKTSEKTPPILFAHALGLWLSGRVHFPGDKLGEFEADEETCLIFRQVVVDPSPDQPAQPEAIFKVCFRFAKFSNNANKILSWIPVPFIIAQPGFRSKTWLLERKTGVFQGVYEFDTIEDAKKYWHSFPMKLMKKRAVPESLSYTFVKRAYLKKSQ